MLSRVGSTEVRRSSIETGSPLYAVILAPELFANATGVLDDDVEDEGLDFETINATWTPGRELRRLTALSGPLIFQNLFGYLISVISALFVGRLGAADLAAVVLANSLYNVTGFSIIVGLSSGMETLCGQAYGAGHYKKVGLILQRAVVICTLACIPVMFLWFNMEPVLQLMHQSADVSGKTCRYMKLISPTLFSCMLSSTLYRYLLAQGIVKPSTLCTMASCILCPFFNWLLIFKWGYGLDGAAYAFFLSNTSYTLFLILYITIREALMSGTPESTWPGWQLGAVTADLAALWQYLSFGIPATAMICAEWWAYEAVILISGALPDAEVVVSTMGICFHITSLCYMVAYSFGTASNTRISNELGAGNGVAASRVTRIAIQTVLVTQSLFATLLFTQRHQLGKIFTDAPPVIALVSVVSPVVAISLMGDGVNAVLSGVLRGCGRQSFGAILNLLGFWCIGIPLSFLCAFYVKLGALGLWISLATVTTTLSLVQLLLVARFDWSREVERAKENFEAEHPGGGGYQQVKGDDNEGGCINGIFSNGGGGGGGAESLSRPLLPSSGSDSMPCAHSPDGRCEQGSERSFRFGVPGFGTPTLGFLGGRKTQEGIETIEKEGSGKCKGKEEGRV